MLEIDPASEYGTPFYLWRLMIDRPEPFYRAIGFEPTGEIVHDEVVALLAIT